jgi:hypothetical protein
MCVCVCVCVCVCYDGWDSSVGIATRYMLTVRRSYLSSGEIFLPRPDRPWGPPNLLYNEYRLFPGVKSGRGVTLTTHLLVPGCECVWATHPPLLCAWRGMSRGELYLFVLDVCLQQWFWDSDSRTLGSVDWLSISHRFNSICYLVTNNLKKIRNLGMGLYSTHAW